MRWANVFAAAVLIVVAAAIALVYLVRVMDFLSCGAHGC